MSAKKYGKPKDPLPVVSFIALLGGYQEPQFTRNKRLPPSRNNFLFLDG